MIFGWFSILRELAFLFPHFLNIGISSKRLFVEGNLVDNSWEKSSNSSNCPRLRPSWRDCLRTGRATWGAIAQLELSTVCRRKAGASSGLSWTVPSRWSALCLYVLFQLSTKVEGTTCVVLGKCQLASSSSSGNVLDEMGEGRRARKLGESSNDYW